MLASWLRNLKNLDRFFFPTQPLDQMCDVFRIREDVSILPLGRDGGGGLDTAEDTESRVSNRSIERHVHQASVCMKEESIEGRSGRTSVCQGFA